MNGDIMITENEFRYVLSDGNWHTCREIAEQLGIPFKTQGVRDISRRMNDMIRTFAMYDSGEVISGNRGYRLTRFADREEITQTCNRLSSQVMRMQEHVSNLRAYAREW